MVERKNLELSVRDFGPIARADIDLRPMTVFVGPSNTGKSYLAILIYALHRFFNSYSSSLAEISFRDIFDSQNGSDEDVVGSVIPELIEWLAGIDPLMYSADKDPIAVPNLFRDSITRYIRDTDRFKGMLDEELARCFGIEGVERLIRHESRKGAYISVKRQIPDDSDSLNSLEYKFTLNGKGIELATSIPDSALLSINVGGEYIESLREDAIYSRSVPDDVKRKGALIRVLNGLTAFVMYYIFESLYGSAYYLPSDRAGVMHSHRVVIGSLIRRAPYSAVQREESLPLLSGVLADFLLELNMLHEDLPSFYRLTPIRLELSRRIEEKILKGAIRIEDSATGYPLFSYRPDGWKEDIPLMNTSSMVSELAPVVLYLRHVVQPGETLIIEEPESHLHPAMQVEFTRQLAAVVRAGVRVIITTHSEWVLDELANLVRVSGLPKSRREGIGGADYALTPEQLGVWLFEPKRRPRGSVVKEIPFDEEFGGFRSGFDEVSMGTYNDYAAISNRLEWSRA